MFAILFTVVKNWFLQLYSCEMILEQEGVYGGNYT